MTVSRRSFLEGAALATIGSVATSAVAQTGAPAGAPDAYARPKPMAPGPFQPSWESLRDLYRPPAWFNEAKFGIFIHWGLYSIPARLNEWYERHMYQTDVAWHTEHYGAPDKFGYKDFIPLFKTPAYRPAEWAALFKRAGARYVVPVAEHHDGFAMYDSALTPWCAGKMGPKRDLMGELAKAVRAQNLIFGCSSHRMEHNAFAYPADGVPNDQFDPRYAGFYGPPIKAEFNNSKASPAFQQDWLARVQEIVDKYEPQLLYFDNGVNTRAYDPVKLAAAAYYYNRAQSWGRECTIATKDVAYLFGSIQDFEGQTRAPRVAYPYPWQCDDPIGTSWGYTEGMRIRPAAEVVRELIEIAAKGGNLLLNVSPRGDGSIPQEQQTVLAAIGDWLAVHGEGIYGSRPWHVIGEGPRGPVATPGDWKGGSTDQPGPKLKPAVVPAPSGADVSFTTRGGTLYAFGMKRGNNARITSLATGRGQIARITLLGGGPLNFRQTREALLVDLPRAPAAADMPYGLRIEGSMPLGTA